MFTKKNMIIATVSVAALFVGGIFGFIQYWPDVHQKAFTKLDESGWSNAPVDQQVLGDSANIEQILALEPPEPGAPAEEWMAFVGALESVEMGDRHGNSGVTTPLLVFYAYIAKHHPETIYKLLPTYRLDDRKFGHLVKMGFLPDWPENVADSGERLLESNSALIKTALVEGEDHARETIKEAFFRVAEESKGARKPELSLSALRYGMVAMSAEERRRVLDILLDERFDIDPRGVEALVSFGELDPDRLLSLIRLYAYDQKSMSSYMLLGARLGETDYIRAMLPDLPDNAKEPTNFYCALCGIVIHTDGMVGPPLVEAARKGAVEVEKVARGEYVLRGRGQK